MTKKLLSILIICSTFITNFIVSAPVRAEDSPILITEVQTRQFDPLTSSDFPDREFIEIYNQSAQEFDLTGWKIEYMPASYDGSKPGTVLTTISGKLSAQGYALFTHSNLPLPYADGILGSNPGTNAGYLAKTGGHVRLLTPDLQAADCIAWGSAVEIPDVCNKTVPIAGDGGSTQRMPDDNGVYHRWDVLYNNTPTTPHGGQLVQTTPEPVPETPPTTEPGNDVDCSVILLSEVLPNPAGTDTEGEFIEVYNPTGKQVSLQGCSLRLGAAGKMYSFPNDAQLEPQSYRAYFYATTGISLTNSGGEVWLLSPSQQTSLTYSGSTDDQAWALIEDVWQPTFRPTPNAVNQLYMPTSELLEGLALTNTEPCPEGKFRNPLTGRCKNLEIEAAIASCPAGQERNAETNRCRKIVAPAIVAACEPGQERNPETGRCRKIAAASSQTACAEGQERNSDTGRCRKVAGVSTKKSAPDNSTGPGLLNYRILIIVLLLIASYAVYEYRKDIGGMFGRVKQSLTSKR